MVPHILVDQGLDFRVTGEALEVWNLVADDMAARAIAKTVVFCVVRSQGSRRYLCQGSRRRHKDADSRHDEF